MSTLASTSSNCKRQTARVQLKKEIAGREYLKEPGAKTSQLAVNRQA
jgi:hypothetical protein